MPKAVVHQVLRHRSIVIGLLHAGAVVGAVLIAYLLRFDLTIPAAERVRLLYLLPALLLGRLSTLWWTGVHRGSWRHAGVSDAVVLARATALGSAVALALLVLAGAVAELPRSILLLEAVFFFCLAGAGRLSARLLYERRRGARGSDARRRVLVIGDDDAAELFVRHCRRDSNGDLLPVGLVSLATHRSGLTIHGVPVVGELSELQLLVELHRPSLLVIALSEVSGETMRAILVQCERTGVECKAIPTLREFLEGNAQVGEVRELRIEDVLGRRPVQLALDVVERDLAGATVLVTGAAGSIGSELARQVAGFGPRRLVLFEQAESPLYFLQHELARNFPALAVEAIIGDIADVDRVDAVFSRVRPDLVFHAAAYKHVPMMEAHPGEAVRNNVLGTLHVARAAVRAGARKFVLISTDKAVNPSSVMGATKRLAELVVLGHPAVRGHGTDFRAVRFGNVLGSAGSVIPLFQQQLAAGGPLTVTHRDVRRYFMTIPEAVELVLQAAALPEASDRITMLDMGEPVRIVELAEQLIRLSGKVPYRDVAITFTGLREGEKMSEDLMSLFEEGTPTSVEQIRMLRSGGVQEAALEVGIRRLAAAADSEDPVDILRLIRAMVPEYVTPVAAVERPVERFPERELELPALVIGDRGGERVLDPTARPVLGERRAAARRERAAGGEETVAGLAS